ncbi:MAG: hypothetical protein WCJ19_05670 [bacterium]
MIYLIGGVPRAGKTTLRKFLFERMNIPGTDTDSMIELLQESYPELDVKFGMPQEVNEKRLWPYIKTLIGQNLKQGIDYVIDGDSLVPDFLSQIMNDENIRICFIGLENVNSQDKLNIIRQQAVKGEWTYMHTDEELKSFIEGYMTKSRNLRESCEKYGIKYFDTSVNHDEVLEQAYQYLVE